MISEMFKNCSIWLRADFHLHTRKDKEFVYKKEEVCFVTDFVNRLKEENVGIGVITNHNKFDLGEYNGIRERAGKENIIIYPGVELSVNDGKNGVHCLVVFDKNTWLLNGENFIEQFLFSVFEGISNRENGNARCKENLMGVLKKLNEHRLSGRDSFVILAHVEQKNGFFEAFDGGRIKEMADDEMFRKSVLGLQKVRSGKYINLAEEWFNKKVPAWVEGSDCKNIEEVGWACKQDGVEKKCYVKLGDANFEALKFALINHQERVRGELPMVEKAYIKSAKFIGGKLDGVEIDFSSELNNFIGIRGSGKSSIIELIRYALNIQFSNSSADQNYKVNLVKYVLGSGGAVELLIAKKSDGGELLYKLVRYYNQPLKIYNMNGEALSLGVDDILQRPMYFGQKDLSNKDDSFESDLLARFIGNKYQEIDAKLERCRNQISLLLTELYQYRDVELQKRDTEFSIADIEKRLTYFKEKGVEDKLRKQLQFDSDYDEIKRRKEELERYVSGMEKVVSEYESIFINPLRLSEQNVDFSSELNGVMEKMKAEFGKMRMVWNDSEQYLKKYGEILKAFELKRDAMVEEFALIKRELNSDTLNPDTFLELNRKLSTSKLKLQTLVGMIEKKKGLQDDLKNKLEEINRLWREMYDRICEDTNGINESNGDLKIEVQYKGSKSDFDNKLRELLKGSGIRDNVYKQLVDDYEDFIDIYLHPKQLKNLVSENQYNDAMRRINDRLVDLLTYQVENKVSILYKGKLLKSHSLGQRASALILFLLAQKGMDLLIIDQPEDDLDNQTIYDEVIKGLLKSKSEMQFIFATHNANIPVLGDSEMVVACEFKNGKIDTEKGPIDNPIIQKSIVRIMEGGQEAFDRRKQIYNIWK